MEQEIQELHERIKRLYPEAVLVVVEVNSQGISVTPTYKTNVVGCSMQTIGGAWVAKADKSKFQY